MKTIILLILFATFGCNAESTSEITNNITEIDRDKDGKVDLRIETFYRGTTKVLTTMSRPNRQGVMSVWSRSYSVGGDLLMIESDEDGDGSLETISILRSGDMEVFTRQSDGSVKPISTDKLQVVKKQNAAISEFWSNASRSEVNKDKGAELFNEAQKKIRDAGNGLTTEKK